MKFFKKTLQSEFWKKILLLNTMKLSEIVWSEANEQFLNVFNNAIAFIFNIDDYTVSICVCVEVLKKFALQNQQYSIDFE